MAQRTTFNYAPHNLVGGETRSSARMTTERPAPQKHHAPPAPSGAYVTRDAVRRVGVPTMHIQEVFSLTLWLREQGVGRR